MNSPSGAYSGATDCAVEMFKRNGITAFYKGLVFTIACNNNTFYRISVYIIISMDF